MHPPFPGSAGRSPAINVRESAPDMVSARAAMFQGGSRAGASLLTVREIDFPQYRNGD